MGTSVRGCDQRLAELKAARTQGAFLQLASSYVGPLEESGYEHKELHGNVDYPAATELRLTATTM